MRKSARISKRYNGIFLVTVAIAIVFLLCTVFLAGERTSINNAEATSVANAVGEIWDSTNNKFNQKVVEKLYEKLGGGNLTNTNFETKFNSLKTWASTPRTSADFRTNAGANVVVTLGGKQWVATYLTQANGKLVLTLMLAERAPQTSTFSAFQPPESAPACTYPSDSYGSSYLRASLNSGNPAYLNNSSDTMAVSSYVASQGATTLTAMTTATALGNEFKEFTSGAISAYILTPAQVGYQEHVETGHITNPLFYSTSNDAYGDVPNTNFCQQNQSFNYYKNPTVKTETYTRWKQDKIWIVSLAEIGLANSANGLWKTDLDLRSVSEQYYITRSSGYSSFYGYYYINNGASHGQSFVQAGTTSGVRPAIHLDLSATADASSSGIAKPTANDANFIYNTNPQTYTPKNFDSATMDITGNVQTDVKILAGSTTHEIDPNGHKVTVTPKTGYNWYDGTKGDVDFKFVIKKGSPTVTPQYTLSNPMYERLGLPTITTKSTDTPGKISWDTGQTVSASNTSYNWTFIPTNEDNYERKTGSENITFVGAKVNGIAVAIKKQQSNPALDVEIYDRYDTDLYSSFEDYIKDCISVYNTYQDGTQSSSPIPNSDYTVVTTQQQIMVSTGSIENQDIVVRANNGGYRDMLNVPVHKAEIDSVYIAPKTPLPQALVYPVTLSDIKNNYTVELTWNFAKNKGIVAPDSKISLAVKASASNPSADIIAGNIDLTFTYTDGTLVKSEDLIGNCSIAKGTYDLSDVTLSDDSVMFDNGNKTLTVSGDIKDLKTGDVITSGVTVNYVYKKNGLQVSTTGVTAVGDYDVIASFVNTNANYNDITDTKSATLKITNSGWDMSGVKFTGDTCTYDGNFHKLEIDETSLPDNRITVTYKYEKDGVEITSAVADGGVKDAGVYTVTASFSNPDPDNYAKISDMVATLTINKATYNMSGIDFVGDTVTYDGNVHKLAITGTLPTGVSVDYSVADHGSDISFTNAGVYNYTATFTVSDADNYEAIDDMVATLTINKANYDMSQVTFADKTVTANGTSAFTIEIGGSLPNPAITVTYTVDGYGETSFTEAGTYLFTAMFSNPDPANYNNIADMTATLTINPNPNPVPPQSNEPNNGGSLWTKIQEALQKGFPLWQIITMVAGVILSVVFVAKSAQYGNRRKKAIGEAKKFNAKTYASLLPVFSTEVVPAGLSNKIWSIMAFSVVGATALMFTVMLITRRSWKKAELAKEQAIEDCELRKVEAQEARQRAREEAQEARQMALQDRITQIGVGSATAVDNSAFEQRLLEMEERHRQEMARREEEIRRENQRRDEEQAKRDEAMKLMLANMMGRQQGAEGDMGYASMDNTDLLVQKVIAGLLPMVQQMIPEPTAYLEAPSSSIASESIDALTSALQQQNDVLQQQNAQIVNLQNQIADMSHTVLDAEIIPDHSEEIRAMADAHNREMSEMSAKMDLMQQRMEQMSAMAMSDDIDYEDDDDEEEWDSILDDEEDDFVEAVVIEEDGTVRKTYPNFRMRLKQSSDKNREWYTVLKNMFCSQKGITYRVYKRVEKIRYQGQVIAVIGIAKRSVKLWLALKPYEYDARRYHQKDVSDKPRFVDVPMYVRVTSDRALTHAQELVLALFEEFKVEARKRYTDRPIQELIFTLKHNKLIADKQRKSLLCETMHVHDCDVLDDETARKCIETKNADYCDASVLATVKLDDIDVNFQDGQRVTLEKLKKAGLVADNCTGFTVTAGQRLTKPLIIVANDFTLDAVKMIALTGGRAIRLAQI